jgi:hypothetical protein
LEPSRRSSAPPPWLSRRATVRATTTVAKNPGLDPKRDRIAMTGLTGRRIAAAKRGRAKTAVATTAARSPVVLNQAAPSPGVVPAATDRAEAVLQDSIGVKAPANAAARDVLRSAVSGSRIAAEIIARRLPIEAVLLLRGSPIATAIIVRRADADMATTGLAADRAAIAVISSLIATATVVRISDRSIIADSARARASAPTHAATSAAVPDAPNRPSDASHVIIGMTATREATITTGLKIETARLPAIAVKTSDVPVDAAIETRSSAPTFRTRMPPPSCLSQANGSEDSVPVWNCTDLAG